LVDPENPAEPLEDPKIVAKSMLQEGADIEAIIAETSLSKPTILGLKGALIKAQKRLEATEDKAAKGSPSENVGEEEISLDLKKEAQITNQAVALARSQQRLKSLDPKSEFLHGGQQQPEGNTSRVLVDLETARLIRSMRQETEEQERHRNNNGDSSSSQAITALQKEFAEFREQMHKRELESLQKQSDKLEAQISDLRSDLRSSAGSNSDLAVVVKEGKDLLVKALETQGPIRSYLIPSTNFVRPKEEAPLVRAAAATPGAPGQYNFLEEMRKRGLVTRVVDLQKGGP